MSVRNDYSVLCSTIKDVLRQKGLSYRELAARIGMSESGLKKILTGKDTSFIRLTKICQAMEVSLADLLNKQENEDYYDFSLTDEQQVFFLKNMGCFFFFWALVYERQSIPKIKERFKLSTTESNRYIRQLENLDLIRMGSSGKPKIPRLRRVRWIGRGPLIDKLYREWSMNLVRDLARPQEFLTKNELFIIRCFKLQNSTYQEFLQAQRGLEAEFSKRSIREMSLGLPGMKDVRWLTAVDDRSFV